MTEYVETEIKIREAKVQELLMEINRLKACLENEFPLEARLEKIEDFPSGIARTLSFVKIQTIQDLISSNKSKIMQAHGMGAKKFEVLEKWAESHSLKLSN